MTPPNKTFTCRPRSKERGQVLPIVALWLVFLLGIAALVVDIGNVYVSYRQLQAATDAAALAGASVLPYSTAAYAISTATTYSAVAGNKNANFHLQNSGTAYPGVSMASGYPQVQCLATLKGWGISCVDAAGANAMVVKQQATVPLYFASVLGINSMKISTTSTAAMRGAPNGPYNVVILVDTTLSMNYSDPSCGGQTKLSCALKGVQVLLQDLDPCSINLATCGSVTAHNVTNPVDVVSLMAFPPVTSATAPYSYCSGGSPGAIVGVKYQTAESPAAYPLPGGPTPNTYQIVPFSSDYRVSDTATTLNQASALVLAAAGYPANCAGMQAHGPTYTYYAGAIYAAQYALTQQKAKNPLSQNVLIILSDGDANANSVSTNFLTPPLINGTGSGTNGNGSGAYMSNIDECQQAVVAARYAAQQGTSVYTISYGTTATGCVTDTTNLTGAMMAGISPCDTMRNMANSPSPDGSYPTAPDLSQFFSDSTGGGSDGSCVSAAQPTTNLNLIFGQIAADLTHARLIPNNTP